MRTALLLVLSGLLTWAQAPPQRIISTAPSITEVLYALGLGDRVTGVTTYCHYPEAAKSKPKIGTYLQPNYEVILAQKPDLVIYEKSLVPFQARLQALKLKTLPVGHNTLAEVIDSIRVIARAAGVEAKGEQVATSIQQSLDELKARTATLPRRKLVFIVGRNPGELTGLVGVGGASYLNELIGIAGGSNVLSDSTQPYLRFSMETLLARDPDVIVDMGDMSDTVGVTEAHRQSVVKLYDQHPRLAAVQRKSVHAVAADIFVVPGPRAVEAARAFARILHPEVFR